MKFYKVIDEKACEAITNYFEEYKKAFDGMLKFSQRNGGSRKKIGVSPRWGGFYAVVIFSEEPDREIWKKSHRDSSEYWEPKRTGKAKQLREEFDSLNNAFPSKMSVYDLLKYEPMASGFADFQVYGDVCVMGMGDKFKPTKKQKTQLERISDLEYEELLAKVKNT